MNLKMKVVFLVIVGFIATVSLGVSMAIFKIIFLVVDARNISDVAILLITAVIFILPPLVYLYPAFMVLNPNEKGVKIFLGAARKWMDSGLCFIWYPFEKITRITKERIELDFEVGEIVTSPGTTSEEEKLERVRIKINTGIYVSFGDGQNLLQTVQYLPADIWKPILDKDKLKQYFEQLVGSTTRSIGAGKTWVFINDERFSFAKEVENELKKSGRTFDLSGLAENLEFVITDVILPEELQDAIRKVEVERREKTRKIIESEGERQSRINKAEAEKAEGFAKAAVEAKKIELELKAQMEALGLEKEEAKNYDLTRRITKAIENAKITAFDGAGVKNIIQEIIKGITEKTKK